MEMSEFIPSKEVLGYVEFDKVHQLWRVPSLDNKLFNYKDVQKVSVVEEPRKHQIGKSVLDNIAAAGAGVSLAQPSTLVKIRIKVLFFDGSDVTFDISKDYLQMNILDYHEDKRRATEVKKALKVLERRNKES